MYTVRRLKIGKTEQMDNISLAAGELYSRTVVSFWRTVRNKGLWLKPSSMMRWRNSDNLHAHSADAVVQSFYASLKSWRSRRKADPNARPPRRRRRFFKVQWKSSAIKIKNGKLQLSNGKGNAPLIIDWNWETPKLVEMGWDGKQYEIRACYAVSPTKPANSGTVAGIDLGEIHLAVAHDGEQTFILNGRLLRSKRQYQNKLKAKLASLVDRKKRGSKNRKRLVRSKQRQLAKVKNQIKDILHKQTSKLVSTLKFRGVQTLAIGDVRDIRQRIDFGTRSNQKLHQWSHGKTRTFLTYKAQRMGMKVEIQCEKYTSQTCPSCGQRHKPKNRTYKCKCGFEFHRDGVGSINIRRKYLGCFDIPVVGVMAAPTGLRFCPHSKCSSVRLVPAGEAMHSERIPLL